MPVPIPNRPPKIFKDQWGAKKIANAATAKQPTVIHLQYITHRIARQHCRTFARCAGGTARDERIT
jgi:hypothetical protein